jgi:hypothetical protein
MDARVKELIVIALVAAFCAGAAVALGKEWFALVFLAMGAVAGIVAVLRLR